MIWSKPNSRYGDKVLFAAGSKSLFCGWDTRSRERKGVLGDSGGDCKADLEFKVKKGRGYFSMDFVGDSRDCGDLIAISSDIATDHARKKCSFDENVMIWDVVSGSVVSQQPYPEPWLVPCIRSHPSGRFLAAQTHAEYIVRIACDQSLSAPSFKLDQSKRFEGGHQCLGSSIDISISPRGNLIASGSADGRIAFYDWNTSRFLGHLDHFVSLSPPPSPSLPSLAPISVPHVEFHPLLEGCLSSLTSDSHLSLFC